MPSIRSQFSKDFIFGAATAAYQIEGSKFGGVEKVFGIILQKMVVQKTEMMDLSLVTISIVLKRILIF